MSTQQLAINDPVTVVSSSSSSSPEKSSKPPLEGVVAFLGPVQFAEGDDWVGVRLIGDSASSGLGKNDGSVQGVRYFENCSPNGGVFVRMSAVTKRSMSRLEELRLKRQLKGKAGSTRSSGSSVASSGEGSMRSSRSRISQRQSPSVTRSSASRQDNDDASVASNVTNATNRSRLEEIRQRRLALTSGGSVASRSSRSSLGQTRNTPGSKPPATPSKSGTGNDAIQTPKRLSPKPSTRKTPHSTEPLASSSPSKAEIALTHSQEKIKILSDQIRTKNEENMILQKSLQTAEQNAREANIHREEAEANLILARKEAADAKIEAMPDPVDNSESTTNSDTEKEIQNLHEAIKKLKNENETITKQLIDSETEITSLHQQLTTEKDSRLTDKNTAEIDLFEAKSAISALEKELTGMKKQATMRDESNVSQYKEQALLQAEVARWQRKTKEVEAEKLEMETSFEDLVLDKEQLQEKLEFMVDRIEEMKIDIESGQIELDELKIELEDERERAEKAESAVAIAAAGGVVASGGKDGERENVADTGTSADAEDVAQALSIQNSRLREAILRLREQTSLEKVDMTRQLRAAEKDATLAKSLANKVKSMRANESKLQEEVRELKEMVDQGTAFESMVENLSERVMALEDNNVALQIIIRELEEGSELNAEMEEAQADEIKALMSDLQNRETIVLNLEEAIKMQRQRELDFQRTVGKYKSLNDTLQQEKMALLEIQDGGEGMKNQLAASQRALSQAAQLVSAASKARKREAEGSFRQVDAQIYGHLTERLESFLPQNVAASEVTSLKGELLLAKIAMKASLCLNGVADIFGGSIDNSKTILSANSGIKGDASGDQLHISDSLSQKIKTMIHQTDFAQLIISVSAECIKVLAMGQWPDLLSTEASIDLGSSVIHEFAPLDIAVSEQLLSLKEEGTLSPDRSNLNDLKQVLKSINTELLLKGDEDESPIIPPDWSPPCLAAFVDLSKAKFFLLGAGTLLSCLIEDVDESRSSSITSLVSEESFISQALMKIEQMLLDSSKMFRQLSGFDLSDSNTKDLISTRAHEWSKISKTLFNSIESLCKGQIISISQFSQCQSYADEASRNLSNLFSLLRGSKTIGEEEALTHALSPETTDPWKGIQRLMMKIRVKNGDGDDLNYKVRARNLEEKFSVAIDNESKLSIAQTKILSLEKLLSTRSKEISFQNTRLSELEALLSQVSTVSSTMKFPQASSQSDEGPALKEEIRVLSEAMEVLQTQVDEYEKEIRKLKEGQRAPKRSGQTLSNRRKSVNIEADFAAAKFGQGSIQKSPTEITSAKNLSLEASIFRPALRLALTDASKWKSRTIENTLLKLPAIQIIPHKYGASDHGISRERINLAKTEIRQTQASISLVNLRDLQ